MGRFGEEDKGDIGGASKRLGGFDIGVNGRERKVSGGVVGGVGEGKENE